MAFAEIYRDKRVLVTGHTGFKGSWLCEWLLSLGARVTGLSLPPPTQPALFTQLGLDSRLHHVIGDVRDLGLVMDAVGEARPDFVFHMAAQSLVRPSYEHPVETFDVNVMGTINILEAVRRTNSRCAVIAVTTDKCYENREWLHSYREDDPMGGHDPYSASKGAAEIAIQAYRRSYFSGPDSRIKLASVRAGNVVGGGDWAVDRIVPDCIRALRANHAIQVRNRSSTRPWQHVLEPLSGYLWLGAALAGITPSKFGLRPEAYCSAFNFGPALDSNRTVAELVTEILKWWPGSWEDLSESIAVHEAKLLNLSIDKSRHLLSWQPTWNFAETIAHTVAWYRSVNDIGAAAATCRDIEAYTTSTQRIGTAWAL